FPLYRTANCEPKLVLVESRTRLASLFQEKIVSIKNIVAKEFKNRTMESIPSRFCDQTDVGPTVSTIASVIYSCLNFEFRNAVGAGTGTPATPGGAALNVIDADTV